MTIYVGGTFRLIHEGHRSLLSKAVELMHEHDTDIIIGVMNDDYLYRKYPNALAENLVPYTVRSKNVYDIVQTEVASAFGGEGRNWKEIMDRIHIIPQFDPEYIPTGEEGDILLVTTETAPHAMKLIADSRNTIKLEIMPMYRNEYGHEPHSSDWLSTEERRC